MSVGKRPCLIIDAGCESEYIRPDKQEEFARLIALEKSRKLKDEFPHEAQPKAGNHHTMDMLYENPSDPYPERVYHKEVLMFKTSAPDYTLEVPVEGSDEETLKHIKRWFRLLPNKKAKLDTRNGLSFDEFEQMIKKAAKPAK